ncbi:hypothetical protein ACFSHT_08955 [Paraburkholderia silviterrae]|uniref:Uncharacterized protein n=1 Tax=Paraburkholderia silviterrae TaxID=2528715 RepID=A0A4R5MDG0_9BURK|nr:hypothetical protein [Paraburkholderia silviterrae]TDG25122.1 hypothetical protein EYW47_04465 [Paraburkholderia silviterrae]
MATKRKTPEPAVKQTPAIHAQQDERGLRPAIFDPLPTQAQSNRPDGERGKEWYAEWMTADDWLKPDRLVTAAQAALLLCGVNPLHYKGNPATQIVAAQEDIEAAPINLSMHDEDGKRLGFIDARDVHRRLIALFDSIQNTKTNEQRTLLQWLNIARKSEIPYHTWVNHFLTPGDADELSETRERSYRKQIAGLAMLLANKSNRYKKDDGTPNADNIADDVRSLLDPLPRENTRGAGDTQIRENIGKGMELLQLPKKS